MRITVPLAAFALLVVVLGPRVGAEREAARGSTLVFVSEFGDPIGQGRTRSFHAVATADAARNTLRVRVDDHGAGGDAAAQYELMLQAPDGQALQPGVYAVNGAHGSDEPRMHFHGEGRSCERVEGRFEIESIVFDPDGSLAQLSAKLEQRCDGALATLWGEVYVQSSDAADPGQAAGPVGEAASVARR